MITIEQVDTSNRHQVDEFIKLPFRLYAGHKQWVPPILIDAKLPLQRNKHPYYEHSEADFFLARCDGRVVGRIAALNNRNYNRYHQTKRAQFYLFDTEDDQEIAAKLFERAFDWAKSRDLDTVIGPKGFAPLDGYGMLIEGFEHRQIMTMMNYNYPYYPVMVEKLGFQKEVDFVSCYLPKNEFKLPDRIHSISERVQKRGKFKVLMFEKKNDLKAWAARIGKAYNDAFVNNWEYAPLTDNEIKLVLDNLLLIADPKLIKVITYEDNAIGFLFGFPDLSAAMQRANGKLLPFGIIDIMREIKRTHWIAFNGMGILPEYQGHGGNAILYSETEKILQSAERFEHADLTQVAETAVQMRQDLINLGGKPYKNHRVFVKKI